MRKNLLAKLIASLLFFLLVSSNQIALSQCRLLSENFNASPVLSPTNANGAWYPDRYRPAAFTNDVLNGENVLKISIDGVNDGLSSRPPGYNSGFYNTQGRKFNQCGGCVTVMKGSLYIPSDWATDHRASHMWATAFNTSNTISAYPIIGFRNPDANTPGIYYYNIITGQWINSDISITYDTWYDLQFRIVGSNLEYLVNGAVVGTISANASTYFGDVMLQAYNFNDPTLPTANQSTDSYNAYWDNVITTGTGGNVVTNTNTGIAYCNIQSAINDPLTVNGHTIQVGSGTYNENIIINKSLHLMGANASVSCTGTRGAESVINGAGGTNTRTINIAASNVTIDGFTVTNPLGSFGITATAQSNLIVSNNIITNVGNNVNGSAPSFGFYFEVGNTVASSNVTVSNNCINNIRGGENTTLTGAAGKANNGSSGGIYFGSSTALNTVSDVTVTNNIIHTITASSIAFADGGKGAYGVHMNPGASGGNTTGGVVDIIIQNNEISNLEGLWAHAIGLEGRTPNATVKNNKIDALTHHKPLADPADAVGVMVEGNDAAGSVMININSFTNTAISVKNTMTPSVNAECNWHGTIDAAVVASKHVGSVDYTPWLGNGDDNSTNTGFQPTINNNTYYRDADGDGYGDNNTAIVLCSAPAGYVTNDYDADDTDGKTRVFVCHNGKQMIINANALETHTAHGDEAGPCSSNGAPALSEEGMMTLKPTDFQLSNYPNPFNNKTRIQYSIPVASKVNITVYDAMGRTVSTLVDAEKGAGIYSVDFDGTKVSKGIYYYRLTATSNGTQNVQTRNMTVIK